MEPLQANNLVNQAGGDSDDPFTAVDVGSGPALASYVECHLQGAFFTKASPLLLPFFAGVHRKVIDMVIENKVSDFINRPAAPLPRVHDVQEFQFR